MEKPLGLVLSGGGSKGIAHTQFLDYFEKKNLEPAIISGASAGALVGAFYAAGYSVNDIIDFFKASPLFKFSWLATSKPGFFDTTQYATLIEKYLPTTFDELKIPLVVAATNAESGEVKYFREGPLREIILASCAIPMLFSPVEIDGVLYIDGAVMDNFPIQPLKGFKGVKVGSYLGWPMKVARKELNNTLKIAARANHLLIHAGNVHKINKLDLTITFPLGEFNAISKTDQDKIFERAKETMARRASDLDDLLV